MTAIPVADRWYRSERLGDGVRLIFEHHLSPDVFCNIWFIEGRDRNLIFDTGTGMRPLKQELAFLSEKPVICVAGHSHFDHMGGNWEFDERWGHPAEAEIIAAPTPGNTLALDYIEPRHLSALPYTGFTCESYSLKPAPLTRMVDEGDVVDLGDRVFKVLHVPGHSPGSIALLEEATGLLLSSDCLYDGHLLDELFHSNIPDYLESMERLKELPVRTVRPGHYDSFGKDRLIELADDYIAGRRKPGCPND